MDASNDGARSRHGAWRLTIGPGWLMPTAIVGFLVGAVYLPAHHMSPRSEAGVAFLAALYVVGLITIVWRTARGVVVRLGGNTEPIAVLGRGGNALTDPAIPPRWRLAAITASSGLALLIALAALGVAGSVAEPSFPHAIARLAGWTGMGLALAPMVPTPAFPGWPVLVAIVDLRGGIPQDRIWRAARLARRAAFLIAMVLMMTSVGLADPKFLLAGVAIGLLTWARSAAVVEADDLMSFVVSRSAADVAKAITVRAEPDDRVADVLARLSVRDAVATVEVGGGIVGVVGRRQAWDKGLAGLERTCREAMTPLSDVYLVPASAQAAALLPHLARHGFALVRSDGGLSVVGSDDLGQQIRIWRMLAECRRHRDTHVRETKG